MGRKKISKSEGQASQEPKNNVSAISQSNKTGKNKAGVPELQLSPTEVAGILKLASESGLLAEISAYIFTNPDKTPNECITHFVEKEKVKNAKKVRQS